MKHLFFLFVDYYKPFIDPKLLEILDRIEKYSEEKQSRILNTNILEQNNVSYEITDTRYQLPDVSNINTAMLEQVNNIRNNNYILPTIEQKENSIPQKETISPIYFDYTLIEK